MIAPEITALRLHLRKSGFHPLPLQGKIPYIEKWEQKFLTTNDEEIRNVWPGMYHLAPNTGVLAKFAPGLDIDIMIEAAAKAVEMLVREHFEERGDIHVRFGKPPKRLIMLRTDEPFTKLFYVFKAPDGSEHKIEILGDGQQYVVDGIHPDTGKPYAWFGGDLATIKRCDLPYVRHEDMTKFLAAAKQLLIEEFGFVLVSESTGAGRHTCNGGNGGNGVHRTNKKLEASADRIAEALAVIPNNFDWNGWNRVGMAVWRASGGSDAAFAAFDAWSSKSPKYDADITAAKWAAYFKCPPRSIGPKSIGAGTIFHLATKADPYWDMPWRRKLK